MEQTERAPRGSGRPLRRVLLAVLALAAVTGGGLVLRQSGRLDLLVGSIVHGRAAHAAPPPDFAVRVSDEAGGAGGRLTRCQQAGRSIAYDRPPI